jgi:hypothetical protein
MAISPIVNFGRSGGSARPQGPQREGVDPFTPLDQDTYRNHARGPMPEMISGENIVNTPLPVAHAARAEASYTSATKGEKAYEEPEIPYSGTIKSQVWQTRYGGAFIELSGKEQQEEFINIVHSSGTHITIDTKGNVVIKSFGGHHQHSEGNSYDMVEGSKEAVYKSGYTIHVQGGTTDIRSEGNLNISTGGDLTIAAAGRVNINSGDALDIAGSKIAMNARADSFDVVSTGIMRISSAAAMHIKAEGDMFEQTNGSLHIKSGASTYIQSDSAMDLKAASSITNQADGAFNIRSASATNIQAGAAINQKAGGNVNIDGAFVNLNSGAAGNAPNANAATAAADAIKAAVEAEPEKSVFSDNTIIDSPGSIGAGSIDDRR